ncbi:hypothetical protein [Paracoccus everestensis]|uniref:hypothetical protein n=1 Tax=Paracoccus everestensis TaxID=2903900 RepID=UPI001F1CE423|nr:hypothetical protein [Paracoccus everestensis]
MRSLPSRQAQQARKGSIQVDRQTLAAIFGLDGHQNDLLHQGPQRLLDLFLPLGVGKTSDQLADPLAVCLRHCWVETHRIGSGGGRQHSFQLPPPGVQFDHPILHLPCRHARNDRVNQLLVIAGDLVEFLLQSRTSGIGTRLQAGALRGIFLAEDPHCLLVHQVMLESL